MDVLNSPDGCIYRVTKSNSKIRVQLCVDDYSLAMFERENGWEDVKEGEIRAYVLEAMLASQDWLD